MRDHHVVEDAGGAAHQVLVPVGDRIERAWIDGVAFHAASDSPLRVCAEQMITDLAGLLRFQRLPSSPAAAAGRARAAHST